jgi:hypothetical protein
MKADLIKELETKNSITGDVEFICYSKLLILNIRSRYQENESDILN